MAWVSDPLDYTGSSPLARGLPELLEAVERVPRIIPARAGFTLDLAEGRHYAGDHPRSRGVYATAVMIRLISSGSSPLARGLRRPARGEPSAARIIPARAGFTGPLNLEAYSEGVFEDVE